MSENLTCIADNLFLFEDSCNIYVLQSGEKAVLFECGTSRVMDYLAEIGVRKVDYCFHSHYHRHVCQGDPGLVERGVGLIVPQAERNYFEDVSAFWDTKNFYDLYNMRMDSYCQKSNVPVHKGVADGDVVQWECYEIKVLHTPGPTEGSVSYLVEIEGKKYLFCGDLICGSANLWELYEYQYEYQSLHGLDELDKTLDRLISLDPDVIIPANGLIIDDPAYALPLIKARAREFNKHATTIWDPAGFPEDNHPDCPRLTDIGGDWDLSDYDRVRRTPIAQREDGPVQLSKHLWKIIGSQTYALVSDSGKVLLTDPSSDTKWLHQLTELTGATAISHAIITHPHDDHLSYMEHTVSEFGTEVIALDIMADIIERPHAYNLPCTIWKGFPVSLTLRDGERLKWEEFEFVVHHAPGHTDYHMALFGMIDGEMICFSGDNFVGSKYPNLYGPTNCRNVWIPGEHFIKTARLLRHYKPSLLLVAHMFDPPVEGIVRLDDTLIDSLESWAMEYERKAEELIAQRPFVLGMDPYWIHPEPFHLIMQRNTSQIVKVNIRNHFAEPADLEIWLSFPDGFTVSPDKVKLTIEGARRFSVDFTVKAPDKPTELRMPYFVAAVVNGRDAGEITEGVVRVE